MSVAPPPSAGSPSRPGHPLPVQEPAWRLWIAPAAVGLGLIVSQVAVLCVYIAGRIGGSSLTHPAPAVRLVANVAADLAFVVVALYLAGLHRRVRASDFGFRPVGIGVALGSFALAGGAYYGVTAAYASLTRLHGQDKLPSELGAGKSTAALIGAAVFVCVIAPVAEEFFFRGFLFGVLRRWKVRALGRNLGPVLAALIVGILFGLAHTGSASSVYLLPLGFLGFVLCLLRWSTGSVLPCIALHCFNNSLALGVNQLHWSAAGITGLIAAALLVVGGLTVPLAVRGPSP